MVLNSMAYSHSRGAMKVAEVAFSSICWILFRHYNLSFGGDISTTSFTDRYMVGVITFGGMLMVTAPILLAYIRTPSSLNNYYTPFLEMMYDLIGCILFLTVGGLVLENYKNHVVDMKPNEPGVALGSLCIINSIVYLVDAALAIRQGLEG